MTDRESAVGPHSFSIIVQGPICSSPDRKGSRDLTIRCLASIRQYLPGAEIILSTWEGAETDGLDCDVLVKSKDPGAIAYTDAQPPVGVNNGNRQIVSTRAGMEAATREFAVKFRGDLFFESDAILQHGSILTTRLAGALFHSRILITPYMTTKPSRVPMVFHFSDIVQVGRAGDLKTFWSIPLAPEPETTRWLEGRKSTLLKPIRGIYKNRVMNEQYLVLAQLARGGRQIFLDHPYDLSPATLLLSEQTLVDNFQVVDLKDLGVVFPERFFRTYPPDHLYFASDWNWRFKLYSHGATRWLAKWALLMKTCYWLGLSWLWWFFFKFLPRLFGFKKSSDASTQQLQ